MAKGKRGRNFSFTEEDAMLIRQLCEEKHKGKYEATYQEIADKFGISRRSVYKIWHDKLLFDPQEP